jgi:Flp pilus assembly protein TadG
MVMSFLNRWRRDRRGVSAVEFAFIAPVLILFYFGVAELCSALLAWSRNASR